ncbi:MAG: amino acid ABC transporter permease [Methanobacteriota archaeon]|nr:MAG: amino acid ABC transporter permease [Euryarchaeota archaeon]
MGLKAAAKEIWTRLEDRPVLRSAIAIGGLLGLGLALVLGLAAVGIVSLRFLADNATFLAVPALTSLSATLLSFAIGFAGAIPMGLVRAFAPRILRGEGWRRAAFAPLYGAVTSYVEAIRGTPAFVQIFLVAQVSGLIFPGNPNIPFWGGTLALTINTLGYQTEVFRAGFQSVGQSQVEAAKSIGMRPVQVFLHITLPQGLRLITLPLVNEWVGLFKASALLAYVAVPELLWAASYLGNNRSHPIEAFIMVSSVYLAIIVPLSKAVGWWERKHRIPGLGVAERTVGVGRRRAVVAAGTPAGGLD